MTLLQLKRRVAYWQRTLAPLGIQHWRAEVGIAEEVPGKPGSQAAVLCPDDYDNFVMSFQREYLASAGQQEIDVTIVHEFLHLAHRDLGVAVDRLHDHIENDGVSGEISDRIDHEEEGLIERLAWLIVTLHAK